MLTCNGLYVNQKQLKVTEIIHRVPQLRLSLFMMTKAEAGSKQCRNDDKHEESIISDHRQQNKETNSRFTYMFCVHYIHALCASHT